MPENIRGYRILNCAREGESVDDFLPKWLELIGVLYCIVLRLSKVRIVGASKD